MTDHFPDDVRRFLAEHIQSVSQLELLLFLRIGAQQQWSAADLGRELRLEPTWLQDRLQDMAARGLLHRGDDGSAYTYRPATPQLEALVTSLAQAYLLHRVTIIELIYSKPPQGIRSFADAFRLRKEPSDG